MNNNNKNVRKKTNRSVVEKQPVLIRNHRFKIDIEEFEKSQVLQKYLFNFFILCCALLIFLFLPMQGFSATQKNKEVKPETSAKTAKSTKVTKATKSEKSLKSAESTEANESGEPEKPYPFGCKKIGYKFSHGAVILTPYGENDPQAVYFIQNNSKQDIAMLQQRTGKEPYIMHADNTLKAMQWAAFATNIKNTKFVCLNAKDITSIKSILDCEPILKICEYPNVKFPMGNRGSYWAATNMSMSAIVHEVIYQGLLLKS